jgi:phosphoglycerate dehydrogenase-like enzyme
LLGAGELALLKPGALLINVSRGAIVVEEALVAALRTGALRGAGLDVFSTEPLQLNSLLRDLPNVVLTPHAGWATREARQRLLRSPVENIRAFLDGRPKNLVGTGR